MSEMIESTSGRHGNLRVERRADGQLWLLEGEDSHPVRVRRCFPWSEPTRFVSLLDDDDNEIGLIADPNALDERSRVALEQALAEAGFVLEIIRIDDVDEEVEIRRWRVETKQGERVFQTRLDDWPREVPGGGFLIRDVAGDLYHVPDPAGLDEASQRYLWAYVE